jgi:hypothetical protein
VGRFSLHPQFAEVVHLPNSSPCQPRAGSLVRDVFQQEVGVELKPGSAACAVWPRAGPTWPPGGAGSAAPHLEALEAIRYNQAPTDARRSKSSRPRHATSRSLGAGPRRPEPSRQFERSAAAAHAGNGRSASGTRLRRHLTRSMRRDRSRSCSRPAQFVVTRGDASGCAAHNLATCYGAPTMRAAVLLPLLVTVLFGSSCASSHAPSRASTGRPSRPAAPSDTSSGGPVIPSFGSYVG